MELIRKADVSPQRLGVFPGTFHPPTKAHLALAEAALGEVDEVLFVLPRRLPHKDYGKPGFDERLLMLLEATREHPRFSVGVSEGGLFIEIARESRRQYDPATELLFLCGRDTAERIVNWDYGKPNAFLSMLEEFTLLVADRGGRYEPPESMRHRVRRLAVKEDWSEYSATEVREKVRQGEEWARMVPEAIVEMVRRNYS